MSDDTSQSGMEHNTHQITAAEVFELLGRPKGELVEAKVGEDGDLWVRTRGN